jgi:hypothetical protein
MDHVPPKGSEHSNASHPVAVHLATDVQLAPMAVHNVFAVYDVVEFNGMVIRFQPVLSDIDTFTVSAGACTLALTLFNDMFPLPVSLNAHTVMFDQLPAPTLLFRDVVVLLYHEPLSRLTL